MGRNTTTLMTEMKITPTDVTPKNVEIKTPQKPVYRFRGPN